MALPEQNQMKSVATAQKRDPISKKTIERKSMSRDPYKSVPRPKMGWNTVEVSRYANEIPLKESVTLPCSWLIHVQLCWGKALYWDAIVGIAVDIMVWSSEPRNAATERLRESWKMWSNESRWRRTRGRPTGSPCLTRVSETPQIPLPRVPVSLHYQPGQKSLYPPSS